MNLYIVLYFIFFYLIICLLIKNICLIEINVLLNKKKFNEAIKRYFFLFFQWIKGYQLNY